MWNWTYFQSHFFEIAMQPFITAMGFLFYPTVFSTIIGYVYIKQKSAVSTAAVILVIFALFGNYLLGVDIWVNLMYILVSLSFTLLVLFFIKRRRS